MKRFVRRALGILLGAALLWLAVFSWSIVRFGARDPLHMKRTLQMSADLGIAAVSSPTPTTRYQGWRSRAAFLARELYHHYPVFGA